MANVFSGFWRIRYVYLSLLAIVVAALVVTARPALADLEAGGSGGSSSGGVAPFGNPANLNLLNLDTAQGNACPSAKPLNLKCIGGNDDRDENGAEKIVSCTVDHYTQYPPIASCTFQTASNSKQMYMNLLNNLTRNGELSSDSKQAAIGAYCAQMTADILQHPSNAAQQSRAQTLGNTQAAGDAMGDASKAQAASAIDYNTRFLQNFTTDGSNRWNQIRLNLFVPIALLLVLPGAVLAQAKVLKDATEPILDNAFPFEGLTRAAIAIFAIGASSLVPNYSIDFANAVSAGIANGYQQIVGSNMYADAIGFQVRGTPVRTPAENQNAGNPPNWQQTAINSLATFEDNMYRNKLVNGPGEDQADPSRTNEAMPAGAAMARFAAFGTNSALTMTWNILCAFQQAYLAYLFLVGPIACAMWVWPIDGFRQALPSWIEGCITICFWSLFWNTCILLMACFKGVDTTNTLIMTALNFLTTASVKFAFDFASLVKNAGEQAGQQATQGAQGGGAQGGGGKSAGKSAGAGSQGAPKHNIHTPKQPFHQPSKIPTGPKVASNAAVVPTGFSRGPKENKGSEASAKPALVCGPPPGGAPKATFADFKPRMRSPETSKAFSDKHTTAMMHPTGSPFGETPPAAIAGASQLTSNNAIALKTSDGRTLFFSPGSSNGNDAQVLSPTADGGFQSTAFAGAGGGGGGDDDDQNDNGTYSPNLIAQEDENGGYNISVANQEGDSVDNFHITQSEDGNGYSISHDVDGQDAGKSQVSFADGQTTVAEYGPGEKNPNAVHTYSPDGSSTSSYFSHGSTTPDMRAVTHPITQADHSGYQTTYYGRDGVNPTGSMTHLDNKNGGWTEASFGGNGQLLNTTSQTMNGDGTYTIASQDMRRDGTVGSSEQAIYGMDSHALQSLQRESTSPDGQTIQSLAQFNANQELVSAHAASFQNGVPVSSMDFARDSNSNYVESQTNYDPNGAISSTASASFDSSGALLGGQMNYANGPLNEVAFARTPDGDFYARQSFSDGTQADSIVSYDAVQSNLANVQGNGFDASPDIDNSLTLHDNSVDNFHTVAAADSFNSNYVQPASYSAPSVADGTSVSGYPIQDLSSTSSTFDASSTYSVSAQDAYHNQAVHQQQHEQHIAQHANANTQWTNIPSQTVDGGTTVSSYAKDAVMPPQEHPNADAIVQKTLASIEQLAVHWMATRMEALKAIEDKPLDSTPAKGLDGVSSMGVVNPPPMPNHIITNWNDGGYYAAQSNAGTASNVDKLSAEQAATLAGNPTEYGKMGMESDAQTGQSSLPPLTSGQPSWDDVRVASNDPAQINALHSAREFSRDSVQSSEAASAPTVDNSLTVHDNSMDSYTSHHTNAPIVAPEATRAVHANLAENTYASPSVADSAALLSYRESEARTGADGQKVINQDQPLKVPDQTIETSSSTLSKDVALPPHQVNMPNADALVAKTLASVEQLAVHWMATRVEALKAIEDKPLDAAPAKGLDGVPAMGVVNPPSMPNHIVTGWNDGGYYAAQSNVGSNAANVDKLSAEQAARLAGNPNEYGKMGVQSDSQSSPYSMPPLASEAPADPSLANALHSAPQLSRDSIQASDLASEPVVDNSLTIHDNSMDSYTTHHTSAPNNAPDASKLVQTNRPDNINAATGEPDAAALLAYRQSETRTKGDAAQLNSQGQPLNVPDKTIETSSSTLSKDVALPPQNVNMPNADAMVQKTLDSLEHLAVQWLATRVQALDAIEDKGLNVSAGNIIGDAASMVSQSPPPTPDQSFANLNTGYYPAANLNKLSDTPVAPPPMLADAIPEATPNLEHATKPVLIGEISSGTVGVAPESVLAKETVFQQNTGTSAAPVEGPSLKRIDQNYNTAGMTVENYHEHPKINDPNAAPVAPTAPKGEVPAHPRTDRPASDKPAGEEKGAFFGKVLDVSNRPTTKPLVGPPPSHDKANIKKVLDRLQNASDKDEDSDKTDEQLPSWMKW